MDDFWGISVDVRLSFTRALFSATSKDGGHDLDNSDLSCFSLVLAVSNEVDPALPRFPVSVSVLGVKSLTPVTVVVTSIVEKLPDFVESQKDTVLCLLSARSQGSFLL